MATIPIAALLPNAKQQFLDRNGASLAAAKVYFYEPGTTTLKDTWQDPLQSVKNVNPVTLDAAGEAVIYGYGQYRQVVWDAAGNLIWDGLTQDPLSLAGDAALAVGEIGSIAALRAYNNAVPSGAVINVTGYYTPADGGDGLFVYVASDSTTADNGGTVIVDAAGRRWFRQVSGLKTSVRWFGAKGDGVTDDRVPIQNCINAVASYGGIVWFPATPQGYYLASGLALNQSGNAGVWGRRVSLVGDGRGSTQITCASGALFTFTPGLVSNAGAFNNFFEISGLRLIGSTTAVNGLVINGGDLFRIVDCTIANCNFGLLLYDCGIFQIERCEILSNNYGIAGSFNTVQPPNIVDIQDCYIAENANYGIWLLNATSVNINGGYVLENGHTGGDANRYGIQLSCANTGQQGGIGANVRGVTLTNNGPVADLWILAGGLTPNLNFNVTDCAFSRAPSTTSPVGTIGANSVRMDLGSNSSHAELRLEGNNFTSYSPWPISSGTPFVQINAGGFTNYDVVDLGNTYSNFAETPNFSGAIVSAKAVATAWAKFYWNGSAMVLVDGFNVAAVSHDGVGQYTLTFKKAYKTAALNVVGSAGTGGGPPGVLAPNDISFTTTTCQVITYNLAGATFDPGVVYVAVFGGNALV